MSKMDQILLSLKELSLKGSEFSLWEMLINCLQEEDKLKQLTHFKKIAQILKKSQWNGIHRQEQEQLISVFAGIYKAVEPKSAHSRTIASILQSTPELLKDFTIKVMMEQVERDVTDFKQTEANPFTRAKIDFVSGHMENFPLGELVIKECGLKVITFLCRCLSQIIVMTRRSSSAVEKTELMHHCLACLKTIITVTQKCSERLAKNTKDEDLSEALEGIVSSSYQVLNSEIFSLECRSAAGMTVALLAKVKSIEQNCLEQLILSIVEETGKAVIGITPSLHPVSRLFLIHGVLAMYSPSALLQRVTINGNAKTILTDIAFWELMDLTAELTDASWSLCAAKTIVLWTVVAKNSVLSCEDLRCSLDGVGDIASQLMVYIWRNWDHPVDGIRHQCRSIFENLIHIHSICQQGETSEDPFLVQTFDTLMNSSWHVRSKYSLLVSLVPYFRVEKILVLYPTIARDLLMSMTEQSIAPYASELLEKLFLQHFSEIKDNCNDWCDAWICPSLIILQEGLLQKEQEKFLSQYFIRKVIKCNPHSLAFVIRSMDSNVAMARHGERRLSILIMWLKVARTAGTLSSGGEIAEVEPTQHLWRGIIAMATLHQALCCSDNQIILDALGLLCDSNKTTEELKEDELELLQECLPLHMANQSASFRQQMVALIKKMLYRMRESSKAFEKSLSKAKLRGDSCKEDMMSGKIRTYKEFLAKFWQMLMEGLSPGCNYPQRATSLLIITTVRTIFKGESCVILDYEALWNVRYSALLLHRLTDTFDANKIMTFDLLKDLKQDRLGWEDPEELKKLYKCALRLAASSKPHHCETASYLARLIAQQSRPPLKECEGQNGIVRAVLEDLSKDLETQINIGRSSLLEAAVSGPMYGILHCIRELLLDIYPREVVNDSEWAQLFQRILSLCVAVAEVASPTVCNSSPEGYIPEAEDMCSKEKRIEPSGGTVSSHLEVFHVTPQMILVCCWRSMKEVSLTLGHLALTLPIEGEGPQQHSLSVKQVEDMGKLYLKLLMESKHRGAFELAYAGFEKLCKRLWRSSTQSLTSLPKKWLHDLLFEVTAGMGPLCATRRSAGLPFAIQAVVATEPDVLGKRNFKETMMTLIKIVSDLSTGREAEKVHALNILRALYRDTRLGEEVFQFVADGVKAAVTGFGAQQWAVRNSSTLLFSALVTRIFGVNREKDELSKKNCMTGREFFSRFPSLHPFLMEQLQTSLGSSDGGTLLHPSLFPTLIILSHLHPSYQEDDTASLSTQTMIPLVVRCSKCAVYKTRYMAARALSSLVSLNDVIPMLVSIIQSLPSSAENCTDQNQLHGSLLMVMNLINSHIRKSGTIPAITQQFFKDVLPLFISYRWIFSSQNECATTKATFLQIVNQGLLDRHWLASSDVSEDITQSLSILKCTFAEIFISDCLKSSCSLQPDSVALAREEASILTRLITTCEETIAVGSSQMTDSKQDSPSVECLKLSDTSLLLKILCSPLYEVRLIGLNFILKGHTTLIAVVSEDGQSLEPVSEEQTFHRTAAMEQVLVKLVAMTSGSECNLECLGKVIEVLAKNFALHDVTRILSRMHNMSSTTFFKNMLELASRHSIRDDICSPVIAITGNLIFAEGTETDSFQEMLSGWTRMVEYLYCEESSTELSVSLCAALCDIQLAAWKCKQAVPVDLNIRWWSLLLRLLIRDERRTRRIALGGLQRLLRAAGLSTREQGQFDPMMHCRLAINLAVGIFIELFLESDVKACLTQLSSWACGGLQVKGQNVLDNQMDTTKFFERGESSSSSDDNLIVAAALLGISSIEASCLRSSIVSHDQSGDSRAKEDLKKPTYLHQLRVCPPNVLTTCKLIVSDLFQEICGKVNARLQNQQPFTTELTFLDVDRFEDTCLQINRHLNCISHLASLCEILSESEGKNILRKLEKKTEETIGRFVTKV